MKKKSAISVSKYYDTHGVLVAITDEDIALSLDEELRQDILKRKRENRQGIEDSLIKPKPPAALCLSASRGSR